MKLKTDAPPAAFRLPNSRRGSQSQNINKAHPAPLACTTHPPLRVVTRPLLQCSDGVDLFLLDQTPVRMISRFLVDFAKLAGLGDDLLRKMSIRSASLRTQWSCPNDLFHLEKRNFTTLARCIDAGVRHVQNGNNGSLTYCAVKAPVRMMSRFLVDFCQAGEPDDVLLQNEIAFCNRRTQLRSSPNNLFSHVG